MPIYATSSTVFAQLISMPHFKNIYLNQNKPKIKLFWQKKKMQNVLVLELRPLLSKQHPPPLQISGYAPNPIHVFDQLISMPPVFSLMPRFHSIDLYQIA